MISFFPSFEVLPLNPPTTSSSLLSILWPIWGWENEALENRVATHWFHFLIIHTVYWCHIARQGFAGIMSVIGRVRSRMEHICSHRCTSSIKYNRTINIVWKTFSKRNCYVVKFYNSCIYYLYLILFNLCLTRSVPFRLTSLFQERPSREYTLYTVVPTQQKTHI